MDNQNSNSITPLLKVHQVSEILGISKSFAYNLIKAGEIPYVKIGSAMRVKVKDLEAYIDDNTSQLGAFPRW